MKTITAQAILTVSSGIVGLSAEQAKTRRHNLKPVRVQEKTGAGEYEVVSPIQFKVGEKFGYSGDLGKDGHLRDPEAEAIAKLEAEDRIRAQVRAEMQASHAKAIAALKDEFEKAKAEALAEQEKRLRAELAPKA